MALPVIGKRVLHLFSLTRIVRVSFLAGFLAFGLANAADVNMSFIDGALTGGQEFAGTGYHSILLANYSDQSATFNVARLHTGTSVQEMKAADAAIKSSDNGTDAVAGMKEFMSKADALGGTMVKPNGEVEMFVDLQAGTYLVSAYAESDDDSMNAPAYATFLVTESGARTDAPSAAKTVHLSDFAFDFPATLDSGSNLWKVINTGEQPHIAAFFKLNPGKTVADLEAFLNDETGASGPPPFDTNVTVDIEPLSPGETVYLPLDFDAGDWVAVCFIEDLDNSEISHFMEGMIQEFKVS